ncbi:Cytoplasmic dynein intermediate chain [Plasmopara halstedii]|uniref:Cytoplasmic dynein intermediate chain n=1 Tax=Plasmopara halstedii TaxID=4781 RepID=A0A0P1AH85_PLAHL|nr:Cytoplasmic dynein intermediate chain [Plasmopara halstedii]CEG40054.1 Cytoplasmic dynein intermediate chain [Plasmopara halstedii]|eukprot:XP_024576423.1 Cytoplasmic dynein intermediate chain [Plasmopara halstedii]
MDSVRAKHAAELEAKRKKLEEIRKRKAAVRAAEESSTASESVNEAIGQQENKFDDFIQNILKTSDKEERTKDEDTKGNNDNALTHTLSLAEKLSSLSTINSVAEMHIQPTLVEMYAKHTQTDITLENEIITQGDNVDIESNNTKIPTSPKRVDNVDGLSSSGNRDVMEMETSTSTETTTLTEEEKSLLMQSDAMEAFLLKSSRVIERALNTSTKFDIMVDYGADVDLDSAVEEATESLKQQYVFTDPQWSKHRAVTDIDVSPFYPELILVSYSARNFLEDADKDDSDTAHWDTIGKSAMAALTQVASTTDGVVLLWSTTLPTRPEYRFTCHSQVTSACFNPFDSHIIIGGTYSGQVVVWDTRAMNAPVQKTALSAFSHTHPIYAMAVAGTKTSYTLISASTDGRVCVWDLDHLQKPLDMLDLRIALSIVSNYSSINSSDKKMEASVTSFAVLGKEIKELFVGTERGKLYSTKVDQSKKKSGVSDDSTSLEIDKKNRSSLLGSSTGDLVREVIVEAVSKEASHFGPVTAMHFNPLLPMHRDSLLLTCSLDSSVMLWSLERPDIPVLSFEPSSEYVNDVRWSPIHPALFAVADSSGTASFWNILKDVEVAVISEKISEKALNKIRWSPDGKSVITGDAMGKSYIYEVPSDIALAAPDDLSLLESKVAALLAATALIKS